MRKCPVCDAEIAGHVAECPSCGFKFKESTITFDPIRIEPTGDAVEHLSDYTVCTLRVMRSPHPMIAIKLGNDPVKIGRNPKCDMFLNDMTVSREHALVERVGKSYVIRDLNSFNGVWVNNVNVPEAVLHPGDIIQIGSYNLIFEQE